MPESKKSSWPKTPGGTIDWEEVFEAPDTGLIALIHQAPSVTTLRTGTIAIIEQLFTRKDDPPEVARFTAELNKMLPDDLPAEALPRIVETVTAILRRIKDERVRKAAEYEKAKAEEKDKPKSKSKPADRRAADRGKGKKKKKPALPIGLIAGIALGILGVGLVAWLLFGGKGGDTEAGDGQDPEKTIQAMVEQMKKAAADGRADGPHVYGGPMRVEFRSGRTAVTVEYLTHRVCGNLAWVFVNRGSVSINGFMPSKISPPVITELCGRVPEGTASLTWYVKPGDGKGTKN